MLTTKQAEELREAIRRGSEGDVEHLLVDAKRAGEMLLAQHDELARLRAEVDELQHAIRVAWEAIDATTSLETEAAMHTLIQAVPLAVRQRWAREDGEG